MQEWVLLGASLINMLTALTNLYIMYKKENANRRND